MNTTWASDPLGHQLLSAYYVFLGGSRIVWKTKKHIAVSLSSAEAKSQGMALLVAEVTWLRWLLEDFGVFHYTDSSLSKGTSAISIGRDPVKHIGVDASIIRSRVQDQMICSRVCAFRVLLSGYLHEDPD